MRIANLKILLFFIVIHSITTTTAQSQGIPMFKELSSSETNINFKNALDENLNLMNGFNYNYGGGGVAVGDINNDGLIDIYIIGNRVKDKLYLNKGNFVFEDISLKAIKNGVNGWHTGANMVDINNDGYLDIFVSRINENYTGETNLLYINNKDNTFTEESSTYGFIDTSITFQTVFFDADSDGDLDCYVLNSVNEKLQHKSEDEGQPIKQSDIFYENVNGYFINKSLKVNINNNSFGLGIVASDINDDGIPDLYISNDFDGRDNLLINTTEKFEDEVTTRLKHISYYGMGVDIADVNNDGLVDIFVLDMGYDDHVKSKENMPSMSTTKFQRNVNEGNHYQYMQNSFQLNNGNGTFSEIAQLLGISKTNWSWGVLFADFDNDGLKDIVISNGIKRELLNQDIDYSALFRKQTDTLIDLNIPLSHSRNRFYRNNGDFSFQNMSEVWGFTSKTNSSGMAYADFDNDGDLDLIINNIDTICSVFENQNVNQFNHLTLKLIGTKNNSSAIGTKVTIYTDSGIQMKELFPVRGFQSSVDYRIHFGLKNDELIHKITIRWPNQQTTTLKNIKANQLLVISYYDSKLKSLKPIKTSPKFFKDYTNQLSFNYTHTENEYDDFKRELLLPHMYSKLGPTISIGDINGDQMDDIFIGGAKGIKSSIYIQTNEGTFKCLPNNPIDLDSLHEDVGSILFDFDQDGDLDLYVCSGGNEFTINDSLLQDRLYINNGAGLFSKSKGTLPEMFTSTKTVIYNDFDKDGDLDLFIGGRVSPGQFPESPRSYLLKNDKGKLIDCTNQICPELKNIGMVTGASFNDINNDGKEDLIVVGEWMPLTIFINNGNTFKIQKSSIETEGLWYSLTSCDIDNDGDIDFIAGNLGLNSKYKASVKKPFQVYGNDFDENGTYDIILSTYQDSINYPVRGRECSSEQMPFIAKKFSTYHSYAIASMNDIYGTKLAESKQLTARNLASSIFINDGDGNFKMKSLPLATQVSPILSIIAEDVNRDGFIDLLVTGNMYNTEVETARYDSGVSYYLIGDGKGNFDVIPSHISGFYNQKDTKEILKIKVKNDFIYLVSSNCDTLKAYQFNP